MPDVIVVGAGLIGLGIAYELAKRGAAVTVYDRDEPARSASGAGAGMLAPYSEATPDAAMLALCRDSLALYPEYVAELRERTGVDARLRPDGTLQRRARRLGRALLAACESLGVRFERGEELSLECDARRVRGVRTAYGFATAATVIN